MSWASSSVINQCDCTDKDWASLVFSDYNALCFKYGEILK